MTILLNRAYSGFVAGSVVTFPAQLENSLIAQGIAKTTTKASVAAGNVTGNTGAGTVAIDVGAKSVTITSDRIAAASKVFATIAQATPDATLTGIVAIVPADGSVTIYGNANATAKVLIDWAIIAHPGMIYGSNNP